MSKAMGFNYATLANVLMIISCITGVVASYFVETDLKLTVKLFLFAWVSSYSASVVLILYIKTVKRGHEDQSKQQERSSLPPYGAAAGLLAVPVRTREQPAAKKRKT